MIFGEARLAHSKFGFIAELVRRARRRFLSSPAISARGVLCDLCDLRVSKAVKNAGPIGTEIRITATRPQPTKRPGSAATQTLIGFPGIPRSFQIWNEDRSNRTSLAPAGL